MSPWLQPQWRQTGARFNHLKVDKIGIWKHVFLDPMEFFDKKSQEMKLEDTDATSSKIRKRMRILKMIAVKASCGWKFCDSPKESWLDWNSRKICPNLWLQSGGFEGFGDLQCILWVGVMSIYEPWKHHVQLPEVKSNYPHDPPLVRMMTTGNGSVRFNPQFYTSGKVGRERWFMAG